MTVSCFRLKLDPGHVAGTKQGSILTLHLNAERFLPAMQGQIFIMALITTEKLNLLPNAKCSLNITASVYPLFTVDITTNTQDTHYNVACKY